MPRRLSGLAERCCLHTCTATQTFIYSVRWERVKWRSDFGIFLRTASCILSLSWIKPMRPLISTIATVSSRAIASSLTRTSHRLALRSLRFINKNQEAESQYPRTFFVRQFKKTSESPLAISKASFPRLSDSASFRKTQRCSQTRQNTIQYKKRISDQKEK